jgi:hypothetical protein
VTHERLHRAAFKVIVMNVILAAVVVMLVLVLVLVNHHQPLPSAGR